MKKTKFSEKTPLRKAVQPIMIFVFLLIVAYVAYKAYVAIQNGMKSAQEALQKKGFTMQDGVAHVKVKGMDDSRYLDQTQAAFVKAWNNSETKGYYSRLWSKPATPPKKD